MAKIGKIKVNYPIGQLGKKPVKIEVKQLTIILETAEVGKWNSTKTHFEINDDLFRKTFKDLEEKLTEKLRAERKPDKKAGTDDKIIDNIKIDVQDMNLRIEHGLEKSKNQTPSALGATLQSLRFFTVDSNKKEAFVPRVSAAQAIDKKLTLKGFQLYSQDNLYTSQILSQKTLDECSEIFQTPEMLYASNTERILDLSCELDLTQKGYDILDTYRTPLTSLSLKMQKLPFNFSNSILVNVTKFIDTFKLHNKTLKKYKNTSKFNYLKPEKHLTELSTLNSHFAPSPSPSPLPPNLNPDPDPTNPSPQDDDDAMMNELLL
jgi:hypothetical protein